ncbi:GDSL-type esterase/lipase family protein [Tundrisphaera lichenicola]|uniref:GDSL-type esterase/lipase family protein n=1 Tax=Tundrisphaera lichenicola TaxID=2029860 RepID=UPI003EBE9C9B
MFRIIAVLLGLSPLFVFECALRVLDVGRRKPDETDPFVGFAGRDPLFLLDRESGQYNTDPARIGYFRPQTFPAKKPGGTFRIFCLGGSTVQGRPFAVETSFSSWLGLSLKAADPSRNWEVINCGGISYASYRLAPILEEVLSYEPDLIVLYTGHNEFLEKRTYPRLANLPGPILSLLDYAGRLRTFAVLRRGVEAVTGRSADRINQDRPILPTEVEALLDYKGGLETYHRDDAWRRGVIEHFGFNLRRMINMAHARGVRVLLANPVVNLETPPFKSEHRAGLSVGDRTRFETLWDEARSLYGRSLPDAVKILERVRDLDDEHAGIWYTLGTCQQRLNKLDAARESLDRARNLDICPLRILSPMNNLIREIAAETETPLVDIQALFAGRSPGGITGNSWLIDHVHPTIAGHKLIARALLDELVRLGWARAPRAGWEAERDRLYTLQLDSLGDFYYLKSEQRLNNLKAWARGRIERARVPGPVTQPPPTTPRQSGERDFSRSN